MPYRLGLRRRRRLPVPVISVGNLTVGGTGKTPMTQLVTRTLQAASVQPCVLTRGYGGRFEYGVGVVSSPQGIEADAATAGDEAVMLAESLPGVAVVAGKDRRRTGMVAVERFGPDVIVLDDGMQFYQLHRDLDLVLLDSARPFDNGWLLPRGLLREPPSHLARAGCVALTRADGATAADLEALRVRVKRLAPGALVVAARHVAGDVTDVGGAGRRPASWLAGRRVATLCGLGNPGAFEASVAAVGAEVALRERLPDHVAPTPLQLAESSDRAVAAGAEAIIITEKDAVKLPRTRVSAPVYVLSTRMEVDDYGALETAVLGAARSPER